MKRGVKQFTMTEEQIVAHQRRNGLPVDSSVTNHARNPALNPESAVVTLPSVKSGEIQAPAKRGGKSKGRIKTPNKTESEYARILARQFPQSNVRFEAYTLQLAVGCRYSPDFAVEHPDGTLEFHEVKGAFIFSKALTKPKTAAELFPQKFTLAQKIKGEWHITRLPGKFDRQNP